MAVLKRKKRVQDALVLQNDDGSEFATLQVDLDIDQMMSGYNKAKNDIIRAQKSLSESPQDAQNLEEYGKAIVAVLQVILGEENTNTLFQFYENSYTEMLEMVMPYITQEIEPKMREMAAQKREALKAQFNRAQRRKMGL